MINNKLLLKLCFTLLFFCACSITEALPKSPEETLTPTIANTQTLPTIEPTDTTTYLKSGEITIALETPEYSITRNADGFDVIDIPDFTLPGEPGVPALPHKIYQIALPPNAVLENLSAEILEIKIIKLPDTYKIEETVSDQPSGKLEEQPLTTGISLDQFFEIMPGGQMRKWRFTKLDFSPFIYDSESGEIHLASEIIVEISYFIDEDLLDIEILKDDTMDDQAEELFINFEQAQEWYLIPDEP